MEYYQKVAYIAFDNNDGSMLINVPLYVKVSELNKNGVSECQEELIHRISEIMIKRYEKQIGEFIAKKKQGANKNDCDTVSDGM